MPITSHLFILVAEDDEDDRLLLREAFEEAGANVELHFVCDGLDLLDHLNTHRPSAARDAPRRSLIVLDLNMPRMNGAEVLKALRDDPEHRLTPVVVLSTSSEARDIEQAYALGANTFFTKSPSFDGMVSMARAIGEYWGQLAMVPSQSRAA